MKSQKALVIFYSRTGTTKKVAKQISEKLSSDIEELVDKKDRKGPMGYILGGRDAMKKIPTQIEKTKKSVSKYDLIILGTPVWAFAMAPALRTYILDNKDTIKDKKFALFCTMGGSGAKNTMDEIESIIGKKAASRMELLTKEVVKGDFSERLNDFLKKIKI
jgi:flavodoxin